MKQSKYSLSRPHQFLALGYGLGLAPKAPGTFGTLGALPFIFLSNGWPIWLQIAIAVVFCLVGFWVCGKTADDLGVHDHPAIVWDEVAGFYITMMFAPINWLTLLVGFLLFRFFDIAKPGPIRTLDRKLQGGFGIMADDILAGIFSLICLQALIKTGYLTI
ncbi:phosphatidylglycerophosphatase A family protein [Pseudoalteromonas xiamenensis]|uniref:Phosphatidylglycerophosphatase A n=1 Tax=Pseudoalteromonas xiamenensis TaxID=882626 RepID=A0A975HKF1_9GAMM|nr:phosphatidylglycerophosphatase A [Pseudoalteromonas xiamenensis]QTH70914.1 phosphatidylglycerophosphatase A [Pseudoalteromonas xiamenensis]